MTPNQLLTKSWNKTGFMYEFIAVYTLIFFVALWVFFAKLNKKENNKLYMTLGFTLATFLMFVIPWSWSYFLANRRSFALANPIIVLLQAMLQGADIIKKSFNPIFSGIWYLIGGEILGGIAGFITFIPLFYLLKHYFKDIEKYSENLKEITLLNIFKINSKANNNIKIFPIKEAIFISLFTATVPFLNYIHQVNYGATTFDKMFLILIVVAFTIYISSYFGYYAFHIFFSFMNLVLSIIYVLSNLIKYVWNLKVNKVNDKTKLINWKKNIIQDTWSFLITSSLTIVIPLIFGSIVAQVLIHSGAGLNF
ncbi:MAG4940 family membrane protein [Mycoplasma miroungirhinis]|uniref:Transmembrane protein n=1 Tax=Mycoplasma miroungirhinis TaxID=754516 RepID=A0A6M4JCQ4_9MOLU|nr:hypothetical protein [Mycoplasma miroungirhinis]QJR43857.1 hypothetical protein HLA92_00010 [Mycoplasma miroungirhinis]